MSNNPAQADPTPQPTSVETEGFTLEALPAGATSEAPATVPATQTPDATPGSVVSPPVIPDIETLDAKGYEEVVKNLGTILPALKEIEGQQPPEQPAGETPVEQPPAGEQPPVGEQPPAGTPPAVEDDPLPAAGELPNRVRVGTWTEQERKVIALRARNPDMTLEDAMARVKAESAPDLNAPPPLPTEDEVNAEIAALKEQRKLAYANVELDKLGELDDQLDAARDKLTTVRETNRQLQEQARVQTQQTIAAARAKAFATYPDAANPESPLVKRMIEIDTLMQEQGNPLYQDPNKVFKLAQMAGNELGIVPLDPSKKTSAPRVTAPPAAPARPVVPASGVRPQPQVIAPGSARTAIPSQASQKQNAEDKIDSIQTPEEYDAMLVSLGVRK